VFRLSTNALRALDLEGAVRDERKKPAWGLPSRAVERATRGREEEVANHLHGTLRRGVTPAGTEILVVPKPKGLRPLSALSFVERTIYRLLAAPLKEELDLPERSYERYETFNRAPLEESKAAYVVRADVSAFYQYVDHDLLHEEIVNQTGHAGAADSIIEVLHGITQKRVGLPQLYDPSDWLSEILIDRVERNMIRDGFTIFRFNDDFRVACPGWPEANRAVLKLDEELRKLGFVLNDDKTFVLAKQTYEEWVEAPEHAWADIATELGLDIMEPDWEAISDYARVISPLVGEEVEEQVEADESDEGGDAELRTLWIEAAEKALAIWLRGKRQRDRDRLRESIDRRLLRQALKVLKETRGLEGLDHCKTILTTEEHVSHLVGRYLKAIVRKDPEAVLDRMSSWVTNVVYLSDWQRLWLLEPLLLVDEIPPELISWVQETATSSSRVVRGRALALLVYKEIMDPREAAMEIASLGDPSGRDLTAAIARVAGYGPLTESLRKQDFLSRLIVDYASP
jgi:Reverse transcriptase (RNA-dependent DNA polymerase)